MTTENATGAQQIAALLRSEPPWDWDHVSEDAAQMALYVLHLIEREIANEAAPWREPEVHQDPYGGGLVLAWSHGYRRLRIYAEADSLQLFVVDNYGIIKEVENVGMRKLGEIWRWFWNPNARWTYAWRVGR